MQTAEIYERFLDSRKTAHLADATIAWYTSVLPRLVAAMPGEPSTEAIEAWLRTAPSPASTRNWLRATRAMFNWAAKRYGVPSPAAAIVPPRASHKLPRIFTVGELRLILAAAKRGGPRDVATIKVLLDTGVRVGELVSIQTERIEYDEQQKSAAVTVTGKTGGRRVPLSREALQSLLAIAAPTGPVFRAWQPTKRPRTRPALYPPHTRTAMTANTMKHRVRDIVAAAGITGEKLGPHTFRHTFATMYLRQGGDIYRLQRLLGHSNIKQTSVYLHLADPEAFAEHARLSPLTQLRTASA